MPPSSGSGPAARRFIEYIVWLAASRENDESSGEELWNTEDELEMPPAAPREAEPRDAARQAALIARAEVKTLSKVGPARVMVMRAASNMASCSSM